MRFVSGPMKQRRFWSHNDKGGEPLIYAFGLTDEHLGTYHLQGATAIDYADMALALGPVKGVDYRYPSLSMTQTWVLTSARI